MFGRRSRSKMQSGVNDRARSVKMLSNNASRQQVTDKLAKNTVKSTHNCSNSSSTSMRPKSCSRARATKMTTNSTKK